MHPFSARLTLGWYMIDRKRKKSHTPKFDFCLKCNWSLSFACLPSLLVRWVWKEACTRHNSSVKIRWGLDDMCIRIWSKKVGLGNGLKRSEIFFRLQLCWAAGAPPLPSPPPPAPLSRSCSWQYWHLYWLYTKFGLHRCGCRLGQCYTSWWLQQNVTYRIISKTHQFSATIPRNCCGKLMSFWYYSIRYVLLESSWSVTLSQPAAAAVQPKFSIESV